VYRDFLLSLKKNQHLTAGCLDSAREKGGGLVPEGARRSRSRTEAERLGDGREGDRRLIGGVFLVNSGSKGREVRDSGGARLVGRGCEGRRLEKKSRAPATASFSRPGRMNQRGIHGRHKRFEVAVHTDAVDNGKANSAALKIETWEAIVRGERLMDRICASKLTGRA